MKTTRSPKNKLFFLVFLFLFAFFGINKSIATDSDVFFVENSEENNREIIKSASEYDYPPFSIVGDNGQADGFSVELLRAVAEDRGMSIDFYTGHWSEIKEDLANGEIDVLPLVGRTPEREDLYDFTVPYMTIYGGVFVKSDDNSVKNQEDLYGKKILVMEGDNSEEYVRRKKYSDNIFTTTTFEEAFLELSQGDYDLIIVNELVGKQLIEKLEINNVKLAFKLNDFKQDWSFAVKKGDLDLLAKLNNGLSRIISNGAFDLIKSKWFLEEEVGSLNKDVSWSGQELSLRADFVAKKAELILDNYIKNTKLLYQLPGLRELLIQVDEEGVLTNNDFEKKFYPIDKDKYWENVQEFFINFYNNNPGAIESVRLFHKNGYIVNGVLFGEEDTNDFKLNLNWFQDLINQEKTKEGEVYVSSINIPLISDTPTIRFAVPIDSNGDRLGFLIINYLANEVFSFLDEQENILFVDKKFEDIEGNVINDWAITVKDSRKKEILLDLDERSSFIKNTELLQGQKGFLEFLDEGVLKTGAYEKINIPNKEWYFIAFNALEKNAEISKEENLFKAIYKYEIYITSFVLGSLLFLAVILLLSSFKIIKLERKILFTISVATFLLICAVFAFFTSLSVNELKGHFKESYINQNHFAERAIYANVESVFNIMKKDLEQASEKFSQLNCDEDEGCFELLVNLFNRSNDLVHASYRISKEGVIEDMYPGEDDVVGTYVGDQDHILKIEKEKKTVLSDVFDAVEGFRAVTIHHPIIKNNEYNGTVAFLINIDKPFESLLSYAVNNNKIFLLDSIGNIISSSEKDRIGASIFDDEKYYSVINDFKKPIEGIESGSREFSYQKEVLILSYTPIFIMGNNWYLATESVEEDVYHGIDDTLHNIWIFTFVVLAVLAVFAYFFNSFLTKALRSEVHARTKDIERKTNIIEKQLKKEEENSKEKEALLKQQKKIEKNLEDKIGEMESFQKLIVDRELKMVQLKEELNRVKNMQRKKEK